MRKVKKKKKMTKTNNNQVEHMDIFIACNTCGIEVCSTCGCCCNPSCIECSCPKILKKEIEKNESGNKR